jgi:hypothetical protein
MIVLNYKCNYSSQGLNLSYLINHQHLNIFKIKDLQILEINHSVTLWLSQVMN